MVLNGEESKDTWRMSVRVTDLIERLSTTYRSFGDLEVKVSVEKGKGEYLLTLRGDEAFMRYIYSLKEHLAIEDKKKVDRGRCFVVVTDANQGSENSQADQTTPTCGTCRFWKSKEPHPDLVGKCHRNAPTMEGFPVVLSDEWCGQHGFSSRYIRS